MGQITLTIRASGIYRYYNNKRIKTKLKGMTPVKYRTHVLQVA
ncbi:MAG: IS3 family transposase [Candidatus Pristimantibacillus sp.]